MIISNAKAELDLLGCCLAGGADTTREALGLIEEGDFAEHVNLDCWRVLGQMVEARLVVDLPGFDRAWKKFTGQNHCPLEALFKAMGDTWGARLSEHVSEVKEWSRRRQLHQQAQSLLAAAANPKADIEAAAEACQTALRRPAGVSDLEFGQDSAVGLMIADIEERMALDGKMSGIASGFPELDEATDGFQKGELSIVGARPSHGKSALLLGLASQAVFHLGVPTLFITLEMSPRQLYRRLAAMESGVELGRLRRGKLSESDLKRVTAFAARLKEAPFWIYHGVSGMTPRKVAQVCRRFVAEHGVGLALVDYLQKMRPTEKQEKRTYEVAEASNTMKAIAVENNVHVCCAAQLNREPDKATGRDKGRMPRTSDLADSAQIERDADTILLLHRPGMSEEASLILAKQRDGEQMIQHLWFQRMICRFTSTNPGGNP